MGFIISDNLDWMTCAWLGAFSAALPVLHGGASIMRDHGKPCFEFSEGLIVAATTCTPGEVVTSSLPMSSNCAHRLC